MNWRVITLQLLNDWGSKPIYYKILGMILVFLIGNYLLFLTR